MNIKNFLLPLSLSFLTVWAIQYFIMNRYEGSSRTNQSQSGQTFIAPENFLETKPLNRAITLPTDTARDAAQVSRFETDHAIYQFSTAGGCLEQLIFKRPNAKEIIEFSSLPEHNALETRAFLVLLEQETPFTYSLAQESHTDDMHQLVYRASQAGITIEKQFNIHTKTFQIDLILTINPGKDAVQARLLFGSPTMADVHNDTIAALSNDSKGAIAKEAIDKLDLNKGWLAPTLFGSENRYFVHALVKDADAFAQRAYYLVTEHKNLVSILESGAITQPLQATLSFYFGPKEEKYMTAVDPRLEQVVEFSTWYGSLSRLLLMVLNYLYQIVGNYGWAIILMTLLINLLLLPLNINSIKAMKKNAEFQKKLAYIKQRYKDNPDLLNQEQMALMSKSGLGMLGGCLPKLIQLPIFFALSKVLSSSIELYKAPFLWIPDLSARDPYYLIPIAIGLSMFMQPVMGNDPKQRFNLLAMALIFFAFSINFSAGLGLYILVGAVLTILQTSIQQRMGR